jgi:hypothetical protein
MRSIAGLSDVKHPLRRITAGNSRSRYSESQSVTESSLQVVFVGVRFEFLFEMYRTFLVSPPVHCQYPEPYKKYDAT